MRFMIIVKASKDSEAGKLPSTELLAAMGKYNEELVKAGVMEAGEGLHPTSKAARVKFSGTNRSVTQGPFPLDGLIAGFWIFNVKSKEEAIEWVKRTPNPMTDGGEIEIRQIFAAEDFGANLTPELKEQEERLRAQTAGKQKEAAMQTSPYLFFTGDCAAAFKFYQDHLGGKIISMMKHAGTPAEGHVPAEWGEKIMHGRIQLGDTVVMASDAPPGHQEQPKGFRLSLSFDKPAEADRAFKALADGGSVQMPIEKTFFAERFGMVTDRFGVPWMINCEKPA